jgi:hypothetical protein
LTAASIVIAGMARRSAGAASIITESPIAVTGRLMTGSRRGRAWCVARRGTVVAAIDATDVDDGARRAWGCADPHATKTRHANAASAIQHGARCKASSVAID